MDFRKTLKKFGNGCKKHSPEILTGIGIAGMVYSTVLAVKATPKAMILIEDKKEELDVEKLSVKDTIKAAWKPYIPTISMIIISSTCIIGGCAKNVKRNAAIAAAYKISENALSEYREKVIETIGSEKEKEIRTKINEDKIKNNPITPNTVIIGNGISLCYDTFSGRYFNSDIDTIKRAINNINKIMLDDMYVSLNELYDELNIDHSNIGDEVGWKVDNGLLNVEFSSHLSDDGRPCLVLIFDKDPTYGYDILG